MKTTEGCVKMQIALTKKLADGIGIKPPPANEDENPLFSWTANWITTWDNRRAEDMLVLVNNANRYSVIVYQVKRKDLKNVAKIMKIAISTTLLAMNIDPEIVVEYMQQAGEVEFVKNSNRKATAWVNHSGRESAFYVARTYNGIDKMFDDTIGTFINKRLVRSPKKADDYITPHEEMVQALSELTGKSPYKYRAFELLITLDLEIYKAKRRIIVPADIEFRHLHNLLQHIFDWENYHLYDFTILGRNMAEPIARLVPFQEDLNYDEKAILMEQHTLSEYFPEHDFLFYTYDMGDNWQHEIELVHVIEEHDEESPYLLEASGQTPPEDVGGVGGFISFRDIMLDSEHPDHNVMKEWARFWRPELNDWKKQPKVIHR